ncbi:MAG: 50S ribosomal protein L10 [Ignavibacteriaceae bacterium]
MNKAEKNEIIQEIAELIKASSAIYLVDYAGINVGDISKLRREFRKEEVGYRVVKNTLFKRALAEAGKYEKLGDNLVGMTGYIFATSNPIAPAKIIKKYSDESKKLSLKGCYIDTAYYDGSKLAELASLPTKPEIVAGILASINAPVSGIVGAINAVIRELVSVIDEISKKEAA